MDDAAALTCSAAKLGPFVPPRRMTCTSWGAALLTTAAADDVTGAAAPGSRGFLRWQRGLAR